MTIASNRKKMPSRRSAEPGRFHCQQSGGIVTPATAARKFRSEIDGKLAFRVAARATMGRSESKPDLWERGVDDCRNDTT